MTYEKQQKTTTFRKQKNLIEKKIVTLKPCINQQYNAHTMKKILGFTQISLKHHPLIDNLGGWWPQAELVDRSLLAYTPAPSNPSFMGAFVQ